MLKKIRVVVSILFFALITFLFLDFAELLPNRFSWLAKIQFIPALAAFNLLVVAGILLVTLLFGRVYCSSVCPMGVYQDIVAWFSKRAAKKKKRYTYSPAKTILRWAVLVVAIVSFLLGFPLILTLIDPYSAFGRIVVNMFKPFYIMGNNLLESIFTSFNNYTFYKVDIILLSVSTLVVCIITFFAIGFLAWKYGRTYCNTVCPVGTLLGFVSRFSLFKIRMDEQKCNSCGVCAMKCKASCIDSKAKKIDYSRCVDCYNCLGSCKHNGLTYAPRIGRNRKPADNPAVVDQSKRQFLLTALTTSLTVPAVMAQDKIHAMAGAKKYTRQTPIAPPGAKAIWHLRAHCTSCHLCISRCPSNVLKPAFMEYGVGGMMQPMMYFEDGFCNYDCTVCSEVCPNGALEPLTKEQKHLTQVGKVVFAKEICVVITEGTNCGACAEHCPTQAVTMIPYGDEGLTIPHINTDICVGCGGCEFICPVRPYRAIYVEGNAIHLEAKPFDQGEKQEIDTDDFGFGF